MGIATSSQQPRSSSLLSTEQTAEATTTQYDFRNEISSSPIEGAINSQVVQSKSNRRLSTMNDQEDDQPQGQRSRSDQDDRRDASDVVTSHSSESESTQHCEISGEHKASTNPGVVDKEQHGAEQSLAEFKEELRVKREQRISAIADLKNEVIKLRQDLAAEREISRQLRESQYSISTNPEDQGTDPTLVEHTVSAQEPTQIDATPLQMASTEDAAHSPDEPSVDCVDATTVATTTTALRTQLSDANHELQLANAENLALATELTITQRQVKSLKEVIVVTKEMVAIRESQLEQVCTYSEYLCRTTYCT